MFTSNEVSPFRKENKEYVIVSSLLQLLGKILIMITPDKKDGVLISSSSGRNMHKECHSPHV